jgi:hypothetical protein
MADRLQIGDGTAGSVFIHPLDLTPPPVPLPVDRFVYCRHPCPNPGQAGSLRYETTTHAHRKQHLPYGPNANGSGSGSLGGSLSMNGASPPVRHTRSSYGANGEVNDPPLVDTPSPEAAS